MYKEIIEHIEKSVTWDNEESFLLDALVLSCAKLFQKSYLELYENSLVTISPLLRQIQENMVVMLGVTEQVYTLEEFVTVKHNPKTIMNLIKEKKFKTKEDEFEIVNHYLMGLKNMLNKFSHTNIEGIMTLFTERFQVHESIEFNKIMMRFFITFLEAPFIAMVNGIYKLDFKLPSIMNLKKELQLVGSLKYVTRHFPESIKNFINESEILRKYYHNTIKDLRSMTDELLKFKTE